MRITSTATTPALKSTGRKNAATEGDAPKDEFSLGKAVSVPILAVMGRRIPTTEPDLQESGKADELKKLVKPGDVVLTADLAYPGWARMEFWTVRADYTHAAYCGDNGNIFEAVGNGVQEVTPDEFFQGRLKVAIIRPEGPDAADVKAATDEIRKHLGKAYDGTFTTHDTSEFYCSELVAQGLKSMPHPIEPKLSKLFGKEAYSVDTFLDIPNKTMVYDDKSSYWGNKVGYWPIAASAVTGAAVGGYAATALANGLVGSGGALVGFGVGLLGSIMVGNKIQSGHYLPSLEELRAGKH